MRGGRGNYPRRNYSDLTPGNSRPMSQRLGGGAGDFKGLLNTPPMMQQQEMQRMQQQLAVSSMLLDNPLAAMAMLNSGNPNLSLGNLSMNMGGDRGNANSMLGGGFGRPFGIGQMDRGDGPLAKRLKSDMGMPQYYQQGGSGQRRGGSQGRFNNRGSRGRGGFDRSRLQQTPKDKARDQGEIYDPSKPTEEPDTPERKEYSCEPCKYFTVNAESYNWHLSTTKHLALMKQQQARSNESQSSDKAGGRQNQSPTRLSHEKQGDQARKSSTPKKTSTPNSGPGGTAEEEVTAVEEPRCPEDITIPEYNPGEMFGREHVIPVSGYFCRLCHKFYNMASAAFEGHCKSKAHFDKFVTVLEEKRRQLAEKVEQYSGDGAVAEEELQEEEDEDVLLVQVANTITASVATPQQQTNEKDGKRGAAAQSSTGVAKSANGAAGAKKHEGVFLKPHTPVARPVVAPRQPVQTAPIRRLNQRKVIQRP